MKTIILSLLVLGTYSFAGTTTTNENLTKSETLNVLNNSEELNLYKVEILTNKRSHSFYMRSAGHGDVLEALGSWIFEEMDIKNGERFVDYKITLEWSNGIGYQGRP